ncbi:MAG TPA: universal stress protein [Solirubrobacterales bacterium]|jgi:nucleotide-binding universal stress UspA family protein|nr:universal stress protein [Solirubrobacterales bacterium]
MNKELECPRCRASERATSPTSVAPAEDLAREAGARIELIVAEDPVVSAVEADFAWDAPRSTRDVLEAGLASVVAGSRRPLDRFLLGSVTKELITVSSCPVLVGPCAE